RGRRPQVWRLEPPPVSPCYEPAMSRDAEIAAIVERGRRTRKPLPRGLWIAALIVGAVGAAGFAVTLVSGAEPVPGRVATTATSPSTRSGTEFAAGLAVGGAAGLVIGLALGRQRRDHSSRSSP